MFFDKKKAPKAPSFPKEKLSGLAVDHFVERYCDGQPGPHGNIRYIMQDGRQTVFSAPKVIKNPEALDHYRYLMGQTLPYHQETKIFDLKDILFIVDKQKNPIMWAKNKVEITQFALIGEQLAFLIKTNLLKPEEQLYFRLPDIEPVIHEDNN